MLIVVRRLFSPDILRTFALPILDKTHIAIVLRNTFRRDFALI